MGEEGEKRSVVVTGASGFLGGRLCHALVEQGAFQVKAFVRPSSSLQELPPSGVELVYGDITDPDSLLRAFNGCSAIFHCSAFVTPWTPDPSKFLKVNVNGFKNVATAVRNTSTVKKLVYVSSFFALGPTDGKVADESQIHPRVSFCTEYEKSKVLADDLALQEAKGGLPIVLTYPGVLYGPGKVTEGNTLVSLVKDRCSGLLPGKLGAGQDRFSFCHVDDVAQGCIAAMTKGRIGERYLLTGENASFNEVFSLVDSMRGRKSAQFQIPLWSLEMVGWLSVFWAKLTGQQPKISYPIVKVCSRQSVAHSSAWAANSSRGRWASYSKHAMCRQARAAGGLRWCRWPRYSKPAMCSQMVRVFKKQWSYSHEKARQELGYQSRPLREGIAQFLNWMEVSGHIKKQ